MTKSIRLGAVDWRDPAWTGRFYPADMPEEWRLSYYASQFNCVFLKVGVWRDIAVSERARWCDDVHSRFVFLLEDDESSTSPDALIQKEILIGPTDPRILWFDRDSDLKELAARIKSGVNDSDVFLISRDADLAQMERVGTLLELMGF